MSNAAADTLIIPGQRINAAFINMDYYIIQKGWGAADEKLELADDLVIYKNKRYLTFFYVKDGKLAMVETFSPGFKTESGIKIGSHRQEVMNSYGSPIDEENLTFTCPDGKVRSLYCQIYAQIGIGFSYDFQTHTVYSIIVFPPGNYLRGVHQ